MEQTNSATKAKVEKPHYEEYVNSILRFYTRYPDMTVFRSQSDYLNWNAAHQVVSSFEDEAKQVIIFVFSEHGNVRQRAQMYCKQTGIGKDIIFKTLSTATKKIAQTRGLI